MSKKKKVKNPHPSVPRNQWSMWKTAQKYPWLWAILWLGIVLPAVYYPTFNAPTLILHEESALRFPLLSHAGNIPYIFTRDFLLYTAGQYRPLSYALLAIVRSVVPVENVLFWHLWLMSFHFINALLVFAIVRYFTPRLFTGLLAASVFALHPLGTVMVNDINQFHIILGLTLCLSSINAYIQFTKRGGWIYYALSIALFFLALFTARYAFAVGMILLAYDLFYERTGLKRAAVRLIPFGLLPLAFAPLLFMTTPHPLHFKYVQMHAGSLWHGFYSITGASGFFAGAFLLGAKIPVILHETVVQIYNWSNMRFLLWIMFDGLLFALAIWALIRKRWAAFGVVILFLGMVPYASVAYNQVVDYVSWVYLYLPLVGFALIVGGLSDLLSGWLQRRFLRIAVQVIFIGSVLFWGVKTIQLNQYARTPQTYWNHVWELNPNGQIALINVGKNYLENNQLPHALHHFFAPMIKDLKEPCLTMARYYCEKGDFLASAIHMRFGSGEKSTGVVLETQCVTAADLLAAAGAPDHAEENLGKALMVNPYNTAAMARLAEVWFLKGFVSEARRMLDRVRVFSPNDKYAEAIEKKFQDYEQRLLKGEKAQTVDPPSPDWLNYVLKQQRSAEMRRRIIDLSYRSDPNDAVIQLEAVISLIENGQYEEAAQKSGNVFKCLNGYAFACCAVCEALARGGDVERAIQIGHRAVTLDSQSELAWKCLAIAYAQKGVIDEQTQSFIKMIEKNPPLASMFFYNLGLQNINKGQHKEAADLLDRAVKAEPANIEAQRALGQCLLELNQSKQAIAVLKESLKIKADDPNTHMRLGRALMAQNQVEEGIRALRTAVQLDPKNPLNHYYLGLALDARKNYEESMKEYRRAVQLNPNFSNAHFKLGNCYFRKKQYSQAGAEYQRTVEINTKFQNAHLNLGAIYQLQGLNDDAVREYEEELKNFPQFAEPYNRIILIYCKQEEFEKAKDAASRAAEQGVAISPEAISALQTEDQSHE